MARLLHPRLLIYKWRNRGIKNFRAIHLLRNRMLARPQTLCFLAWDLFPIPPTEVRAVKLKLSREEIRERNLDKDSENTEFGFLAPAFSLILSKTRNLSKLQVPNLWSYILSSLVTGEMLEMFKWDHLRESPSTLTNHYTNIRNAFQQRDSFQFPKVQCISSPHQLLTFPLNISWLLLLTLQGQLTILPPTAWYSWKYNFWLESSF